jgi:fructose/tagatose bisphosphate aldolase
MDEDEKLVDVIPILERAVKAGYTSLMVDGSKLPLTENIRITKEASVLAHTAGIACEAELATVMCHENGSVEYSYDEIFAKKLGFTDPDEAKRFVAKSQCDWLSVAVGSIHGAIASNLRKQKKSDAQLDIMLINILRNATGVPLVLHDVSGIRQEYIIDAIKSGIAKINVAADIRQPYEQAMEKHRDVEYARSIVYEQTCLIISEFLKVSRTGKL